MTADNADLIGEARDNASQRSMSNKTGRLLFRLADALRAADTEVARLNAIAPAVGFCEADFSIGQYRVNDTGRMKCGYGLAGGSCVVHGLPTESTK